MADMVWSWENKDYNASPITIGQWQTLGNYLKSRLLTDLKDIDEFELRQQMQMTIQMRDYDESDILRYWGRRDIRYKVFKTMFKDNPRVTDLMLNDWGIDVGFAEFVRSVLKESGINFVEEKTEPENPTTEEAEPSATSE